MKKSGLAGAIRRNRVLLGWMAVSAAALAWLMLYKLGSLTGGFSRDEVSALASPLGWHGIFSHPLYLPLELLRSALFSAFPDYGQALGRLPNAILGVLAVVSFACLIRLWYGLRIALMASAMFATSAWTLHVSRLASFDAVYLWSMPTLLLGHFVLRKYYKRPLAWIGSLAAWALLLYVPGMVWFVLVDVVWQRRYIAGGWRHAAGWWARLIYTLVALVWLPLLVIDLQRPGRLLSWLGLPQHLGSVLDIARNVIDVPYHLFIRASYGPQLWLGHAPVLDIFALAMCALGVYFYVTHWRSARSRFLGIVSLMGLVLIGLAGPVTSSLLIPLLYVAIATGMAYLLNQWLKTFPNNPLARGVGLGLLVAAVLLSCAYNYRAYFIAWPHASATRAVFQYRRHP